MKTLLALILLVSISGCTDNQAARNFGGSAKMELPKGQKLVHITWKDDELWYLARPFREGEQAETYQFQEKSSFGLVEGKFEIKEVK